MLTGTTPKIQLRKWGPKQVSVFTEESEISSLAYFTFFPDRVLIGLAVANICTVQNFSFWWLNTEVALITHTINQNTHFQFNQHFSNYLLDSTFWKLQSLFVKYQKQRLRYHAIKDMGWQGIEPINGLTLPQSVHYFTLLSLVFIVGGALYVWGFVQGFICSSFVWPTSLREQSQTKLMQKKFHTKL